MDGKSFLHIACETGNLIDVEFLLLNGHDVHSVTINGETPIFFAAKYGHAHIVKYLRKNGADLYGQTTYGETALLWCLRNKIPSF